MRGGWGERRGSERSLNPHREGVAMQQDSLEGKRKREEKSVRERKEREGEEERENGKLSGYLGMGRFCKEEVSLIRDGVQA